MIRIIRNLTLTTFIVFVLAACSTSIYHGKGNYVDVTGKHRDILLQWKAQEYLLPFENKVDYGSVSLQGECIKDVLLDSENSQEHGLVFKERPQQYTVVDPNQKIKIGNYIVCAKVGNNISFSDLGDGKMTKLYVYCKAKQGGIKMLPVKSQGYTLNISKSKQEVVLSCRP